MQTVRTVSLLLAFVSWAVAQSPIGSIDLPDKPVRSGTLRVEGWALAFDGVREVGIWLEGQQIGAAQLGLERLDVQRAYPNYPSSRLSGYRFEYEISDRAPGVYELKVTILSTSGAVTEMTKKINIAMPPMAGLGVSVSQPFGDFPPPRFEGESIVLEGWALDDSGIKAVEVYLDDQAIGQATTGIDKLDVEAAFPNYPFSLNSGFSFEWPRQELETGRHVVTARFVSNDYEVTEYDRVFWLPEPPEGSVFPFWLNLFALGLITAAAVYFSGKTVLPLVLSVYAVFTFLLLHPYWLNLTTALHDRYDALLSAWTLAWVPHQMAVNPLYLYHANIFYPNIHTLAFSESMIPQALLTAPIVWITANPVLALNVNLLLSFFASAVGMFLLVRHLTGNLWAGMISGIIFAFSPYHLTQATYLPLTSIQWLPFTMLFLHRYHDGRKRRDLLLFGLFLLVQFLSSIHAGLYFSVVILAVIVALLIQSYLRQEERVSRLPCLKLLSLFVICMLLLYAPLRSYFRVDNFQQAERLLSEGASLPNYLAPRPENWLYGETLSRLGGAEGHYLFFGFTALALALCGLLFGSISQRSGRFYVALYGCVGVVAALFSLASKDTYARVYQHVPGVDRVRVPEAAAALVSMAVAALAGYGLVWLLAKLRTEKACSIAGVVLLFLLGLEYFARPLPLKNIEHPSSVPEVYHWLRNQPGRFSILELPLDLGSEKWNPAVQMYYSAYHWKNLLTGYSAYYPSSETELRLALRHFPSHESTEFLQNQNVKFLLVNMRLFREWGTLDQRLRQYPKDFFFVERVGEHNVYQMLRPKPTN